MSIKKAMQTYARQGGTSAIFVHDDGLQLISEQDREERIRFYADHGIGWVARPKHDDSEGGFRRRGRFKKASNMNYGLALSLKMEEIIRRLEIERGEKASLADSDDDDDAEDIEEQALRMAVEESYEEGGRLHKTWAHNAKALRIGEIILIVDSDTIVPEVRPGCFCTSARARALAFRLPIAHYFPLTRIASETLLASLPNVRKLLSFSTTLVSFVSLLFCLTSVGRNAQICRIDVMQVAHHYFENGIAHFTRRINKCISMACANGEVAPFVGHNAFLRWSALQDAAFEDTGDNNKKKIWSEENVSEDFDMALRLQVWFLCPRFGITRTDCRDVAQGIHHPVVDLFGRRL